MESRLWDRHTGESMRPFVGHTDAVHAVRWHKMTALPFPDPDCRLLLWRMETGELLYSFTEHGGPVTARLVICPNGRHAASGVSRDRTLRLWDLEERICRAVVPVEGAPLTIALASNGETMLAGDRVGNVHCFSIQVR